MNSAFSPQPGDATGLRPGFWPAHKEKIKAMLAKSPFLYRQGLKIDDFAKVSPIWITRLWWTNRKSDKARIGFGPILTGERELGNRKWEIDPIVNYINRKSADFSADIFFRSSDLGKYDAVVIVKHMSWIDGERLESLKRSGTALFFNTSDNIVFDRSCRTEKWFIDRMDGIIAESPETVHDLNGRHDCVDLITTPIISRRFKTEYHNSGPIRIVWEGYFENLEVRMFFNRIVRRLKHDSGRDISIVYHVNGPAYKDDICEHIPWKLRNWERVRIGADIAVDFKDPGSEVKIRKPRCRPIWHRACRSFVRRRRPTGCASSMERPVFSLTVKKSGIRCWRTWSRMELSASGLDARRGSPC
jgi:hypothetical protein